MRISAREVVLPKPGGAAGVFRRRLTDEHILDIYLVVDAVTSSISLEVEGLISGLRLPLVELGDVLDLQINDHLGILKIELLSENYLEVFQVLVDDLVDSAIKNQGPEPGGTAIVRRLHRWERLLEASRHGLSNSAQKGLFGELTILECISDAIGISAAVDAWLGPESGVRDFEIGDVGIEVKTTATKGALSVKISSERQLETIVINKLFLWCVSIEKVAQGAGLNETVNKIRALIGSDLELAEKFEQKLMQIGYLADDLHRYKAVYAIRNMFIYRVAEQFPRIVSTGLHDCISDVSYRIFLEGCAEWAVEEEELFKELKID